MKLKLAVHMPLCGNYGNILSHIFGKNFVKVTALLKELLKSWFDEIFFGESNFFLFPHCDMQREDKKTTCKSCMQMPHMH